MTATLLKLVNGGEGVVGDAENDIWVFLPTLRAQCRRRALSREALHCSTRGL